MIIYCVATLSQLHETKVCALFLIKMINNTRIILLLCCLCQWALKLKPLKLLIQFWHAKMKATDDLHLNATMINKYKYHAWYDQLSAKLLLTSFQSLFLMWITTLYRCSNRNSRRQRQQQQGNTLFLLFPSFLSINTSDHLSADRLCLFFRASDLSEMSRTVYLKIFYCIVQNERK